MILNQVQPIPTTQHVALVNSDLVRVSKYDEGVRVKGLYYWGERQSCSPWKER